MFVCIHTHTYNDQSDAVAGEHVEKERERGERSGRKKVWEEEKRRGMLTYRESERAGRKTCRGGC
jgi:hypothetical protein